MTKEKPTPPEQSDALLALAVLGLGDSQALAAVLEAAPSSASLGALNSHPGVRQEADRWFIEQPAAMALLATLEESDPARYRQLHRRGVTFLGNRLHAGDQEVEPAFLASFDRLASRLLLDDPQGLGDLVAFVRSVPVESNAGRHLVRYFHGVGLAKADRYAEALLVFDELLAEPGLDLQLRARALNSRAIYCRITGRLQEAASGFRTSLAVWERLSDPLRQGMALHNLGILAYELGEYQEAEERLAEAVQRFEAAGSARWLAAAQNELGLVYRDEGRLAEAQDRLETAIRQLGSQGAQDARARALNNLGEVLLLQNRLVEAAAIFRQALEAMETRAYAVDVYLNEGLVYQILGDLPGAQRAYERALKLAEEIDRREALALAHYRLGEILRRQGDSGAALLQLEAAAGAIEAARAGLWEEKFKISLLGRWVQIYEALVLHCLETGDLPRAFKWAERARARAFAETVASNYPPGQLDREGGETPASFAEVAVASAWDLQAGLPARTKVLCYFTTGVLERDQPLLRDLTTGSSLREHLLTPARTLLFEVDRERLAAHTCALDPNTLSSASPKREERGRFLEPTVLRRLYALLLAPAGTVLNVSEVYVIPHGPLHRIPFAALETPDGEPVVRAAGPALAYAPSATLLLQAFLAHSAHAYEHKMLAVGYAGEQASSLRHTEAEARYVARLAGGEAWVGPLPKAERLRNAASDYHWIHLACHGQFNEAHPLESYLEIGSGERLTADTVLSGWRLRARLVTLSACQTGISRVLRADEPMGLVRAFLAAGAKAVLVSQWQVDDLAAFVLMRRFYEALLGGEVATPAAALRDAQSWLRHLAKREVADLLAATPATTIAGPALDWLNEFEDGDCPFSHPRHWAAFILVGR